MPLSGIYTALHTSFYVRSRSRMIIFWNLMFETKYGANSVSLLVVNYLCLLLCSKVMCLLIFFRSGGSTMTDYFNLKFKQGIFKEIARWLCLDIYMYPVETSAGPIFRLRLATFQRRSNDANHLPSSIFIFLHLPTLLCSTLFIKFHRGVQKSTRCRKPLFDSV